ncbi:hypothetical protein [Rubripirellula lacrimiformis]|nr:hypothetical protein [Rubripirellula lacrimiformis]
MAQSHFASLSSKPLDVQREVREFGSDFLRGYRDTRLLPNACFDPAGFVAGIEYRNRHPNAIHQVLTSYGYTPATYDGVWITGFEVSVFKPDNAPNFKDSWWLSVSRECKEDRLKWKPMPSGLNAPLSDNKQILPGMGNPHRHCRVRIHGYLSPKGKYGHLGFNPHEFVATRIAGTGQLRTDAKQASHGYRSYDGQPAPTDGDD